MRIVGGTLSGRKIEPPESLTTRPMMDRVRQALFNILLHNDWGSEIGSVLEGGQVLDAFCGTGALSFEALSWGAEFATLFDKDRAALKVAQKNAHTLGLQGRTAIISADSLSPPKGKNPCRLVFLAPPYRKNLIEPSLLALDQAGWIAAHALIVAETAKKETLGIPVHYTFIFSRFYGDTALHFIRR